MTGLQQGGDIFTICDMLWLALEIAKKKKVNFTKLKEFHNFDSQNLNPYMPWIHLCLDLYANQK